MRFAYWNSELMKCWEFEGTVAQANKVQTNMPQEKSDGQCPIVLLCFETRHGRALGLGLREEFLCGLVNVIIGINEVRQEGWE
jgi:hypothetical protein